MTKTTDAQHILFNLMWIWNYFVFCSNIFIIQKKKSSKGPSWSSSRASQRKWPTRAISSSTLPLWSTSFRNSSRVRQSSTIWNCSRWLMKKLTQSWRRPLPSDTQSAQLGLAFATFLEQECELMLTWTCSFQNLAKGRRSKEWSWSWSSSTRLPSRARLSFPLRKACWLMWWWQYTGDISEFVCNPNLHQWCNKPVCSDPKWWPLFSFWISWKSSYASALLWIGCATSSTKIILTSLTWNPSRWGSI